VFNARKSPPRSEKCNLGETPSEAQSFAARLVRFRNPTFLKKSGFWSKLRCIDRLKLFEIIVGFLPKLKHSNDTGNTGDRIQFLDLF
jgi:hypothetical protein